MSIELEHFTARLLAWFELHGRHTLPWQVNPTPYRVWVSEVMLQQTQVATVIPYYERFMLRFPDVRSLAAAPLDEVLHLWTGLGYYARARNLRACAQALVAQHDCEFPRTIEAVTALPGIGRSTAGAILALSRGERHPILDGNVKRVLARVFGIAGDPSSAIVVAQMWAQAKACTPESNVGAYTQAIMDLGATLCTRARPACTVCPMNDGCVAALEGRQAELPGRKSRRVRGAREATLLIAETVSEASVAVLVERRPPVGLWGGLWSPPQFESAMAAVEWCRREIGEVELDEADSEAGLGAEDGACVGAGGAVGARAGARGRVRAVSAALAPINHAFTHFDLRLNPLRVRCRPHEAVREDEDRLWYRLESPPRVGLPQPIRLLFERLRLGDGG